MASSFPREVQKWLQSLNLSQHVRNPKRDVSNGFIVAEILNRFYPNEVKMHTYSRATQLEQKIKNWELIFKFFTKNEDRKLGTFFSKAEVEVVMHEDTVYIEQEGT